jgi:hypothetical protein
MRERIEAGDRRMHVSQQRADGGRRERRERSAQRVAEADSGSQRYRNGGGSKHAPRAATIAVSDLVTD